MDKNKNLPAFAIHTLGCKVNTYESDAMAGALRRAGFREVAFSEPADVYIINTCTVTNIADKKSRQMLHRARKMNPEAVVAACGCYVQEKPDEAADCVDIVIGNNRKKEIVRILEEYENSRGGEKKRPGEPLKDLVDIGHTKEYEELSLSRTAEHTRAYIKVQDGCNQFCSYCIIPYARGRVRSRSKDHVLEEVQALAGAGYQEVVLTGIHLSSYGIDNGEDLLSLILAGPHFHLSLQSGCTETLKRMNRRYTAEEYFEKCELLRKYFHEPALTTDVIVGFPGETQEEFEASRAFVDKVDFYETHVFKYSRREGTKAAVMPDQVPEPVKAERSAILLELSKKKQKAYEERLLGTTQEVLIEEEIERDGEIWQVGHTREYVKAGIKSRENLVNQLVPVEIENPFQIIH